MDRVDDAIFHQNLAFFHDHNPEVAAHFTSMPMTNILLLPAEHGETYNGSVWDVQTQQWVGLCGNDPWGEAKRLADTFYDPTKRIFMLLGLGLGHFPVEFARRLKPSQRLLLIEADPIVTKAAMHAVDFRAVFAQANVHFVIGENAFSSIQQWLLSLTTDEKCGLTQPMRAGYTERINKEFYDRASASIDDMLRYHFIGFSTWARHGDEISVNDWGNIPELCVTPGLQALESLWKGRPAICLAAGPSLKQSLLTLLENRDLLDSGAMGIIAVGTIYALLQSLSITPDIVTAIDFQRLCWTDQFAAVPCDRQTSLVYLHSVYHQIPRRWPGPKFVAMNSTDTTQWLSSFLPKGHAAQVQTVAHLNLIAALELGADPILLVGQDLAMSKEEHHALGARAQDSLPGESEEPFMTMPGIDGRDVYTRHAFLSMRTVFSHIAARYPGRNILNCTHTGLPIPGIPEWSFAGALANCRGLLAKANGAAKTSPLRMQLRNAYAQSLAEIDWALIADKFKHMRQEFLNCITIGRQLNDLFQKWDMADDGQKDAYAQEAEALRKTMDNNILAVNMMIGRRFEYVQSLSGIPPDPDDPIAVRDFRVEALRLLSQHLTDDARIMVRRIDEMLQRFHGYRDILAMRDAWPRIHMQHYHQIAERETVGSERWCYAAFARNEYYFLCALADAGMDIPAHLVEASRRIVQRFVAQGDQVRCAYFGDMMTQRRVDGSHDQKQTALPEASGLSAQVGYAHAL